MQGLWKIFNPRVNKMIKSIHLQVNGRKGAHSLGDMVGFWQGEWGWCDSESGNACFNRTEYTPTPQLNSKKRKYQKRPNLEVGDQKSGKSKAQSPCWRKCIGHRWGLKGGWTWGSGEGDLRRQIQVSQSNHIVWKEESSCGKEMETIQSCCDMERSETRGQVELKRGLPRTAEHATVHSHTNIMGNTVSEVLGVALRLKNKRTAPTCGGAQSYSRDSLTQAKKTGLLVWVHLRRTNQPSGAAGREQNRKLVGNDWQRWVLPTETGPTTIF